MLIDLPPVWIIVLNVGGWLAIQLGLAWVFTKMPIHWFNPAALCKWEHNGKFYERVLRIKKWKDWLPDAAKWFGSGFAKGALTGTSRAYLERFARETWRSELCHWTAIACTPVFLSLEPVVGRVDCCCVRVGSQSAVHICPTLQSRPATNCPRSQVTVRSSMRFQQRLVQVQLRATLRINPRHSHRALEHDQQRIVWVFEPIAQLRLRLVCVAPVWDVHRARSAFAEAHEALSFPQDPPCNA